METGLTTLVLLPLGLGLFGFVEPCSIAPTLLFIKTVEGKAPAEKLTQVGVFTLTRAVFIGVLRVRAVLAGSAFLGVQRVAWFVLGTVYALLGLVYLAGRAGTLMTSLGPSLRRLADTRGAAALGMVFGLNIPACAAPLIFALLAAAAASGATGATLATGFIGLALFGFFAPARRLLDWVAGLSRRIPFWTGLLFLALGGWSIWFALFV
ncbi:MAG: hypothetical protein ABI364_08875 [Caldimonas sp.]